MWTFVLLYCLLQEVETKSKSTHTHTHRKRRATTGTVGLSYTTVMLLALKRGGILSLAKLSVSAIEGKYVCLLQCRVRKHTWMRMHV